MDVVKLEKCLKDLGQPVYRFKQIIKAVYQDGVLDFAEMTNLSKILRDQLSGNIDILSFKIRDILGAQDKQSYKALFELADGNMIESVLMSPKPGMWSVCVSSQVGCPLGCAFCATGQMGLKRNLSVEEITDQVLFWKGYLKEIRNQKFEIRNDESKIQNPKFPSQGGEIINSISNIVYMGMGEPFLNWDNVKRSLQILTDKDLFGFGSRSISVSTAGIPEGIRDFSKEFPQINLAISLHFADDKLRSRYMPVNRTYGLDILKQTLKEYLQKNSRKIFIEYVMLSGINDHFKQAEELANFLKSLGRLQLIHVNLIRYNMTGQELNSSSKIKTAAFRDALLRQHISVTIRKSLGQEIQGACGQLAVTNKQVGKS